MRDEVIPQLDAERYIFLSVTIETNDSDEALAQYAEEQGFPWRFAVATPELLSAWIARFGQQVTIPPSQPHFAVRADGTVTDLMLGNPTAEETLDLLRGLGEA